jgi:hypothetical protein
MPVKDSNHSRPFAALAAMVFGLCVVLAPTVARGEDDGAQVSLSVPDPEEAANSPIPIPPAPALGADGTPLPMEGVPSDTALANASARLAGGLADDRIDEMFPAIAEDPLRTFETGEVVKFLNDHVARVDPAGPGGPSILASGAPLRDPNEGAPRQAIDLDVEREGGHFEAVNPLVDVSFPVDLSHPLQLQKLGLGISVASPEAAQSTGKRLPDGKLLYHEAAKDTDVVFVPVTGGAQVLTQIRSEDAPEELSFEVTLPAGTELHGAGTEGIEIVRDGKRLAVITSPLAFDADGIPVDSRLELRANDTIGLITNHRAGHAYPVLVDPEVSVWENWLSSSWQAGNSSAVGWAQGSWIPGAYSAPITTPTNGNPQSACGSAYNCWQGGLYAQAGANWQLLPGAVGQWIYQPSGTSSYITQASLSPINYSRNGENGWFTPHAYYGVFSTDTQTWPPGGVGTKGDNGTTSFYWTRPENGPKPDEVVFGMGTSVDRTGPRKLTANRTTALGGASIGVADGEAPSVDDIVFSPDKSDWENAYSGSATITATDQDANGYGLGMYSIGFKSAAPGSDWAYQNATTTITLPNPPDYKGPTQTQTVNCSGTRVTPCPTTLTKTFNYDSTGFPEGINTVQVKGTDVLGKTDVGEWEIFIDQSAPTLNVTGGLRQGTGAQVQVTTTDGTAGSPQTSRSGVEKVELLIDDELDAVFDGELAKVTEGGTNGLAIKEQECLNDNCAMTPSFTLDTNHYPERLYDFRVRTTDRVGHVRQEDWRGLLESKPPQINPISGSLTEGWHHSGSPSVSVKATDAGAGVHKITLDVPGLPLKTHEYTCAPPCPSTPAPATFNVPVSSVPQGLQTITAKAYGPGDTTGSTRTAQIKVNHNLPVITEFSGPTSWLTTGTATVSVAGHSDEPGVEEASLDLGEVDQLHNFFECDETACETDVSHEFEVDVDELPEGVTPASVRLLGPGGAASTPVNGEIGVDRTDPELDASGSMIDSPGSPVGVNPYVEAEAIDSHSGPESVELRVDNETADSLGGFEGAPQCDLEGEPDPEEPPCVPEPPAEGLPDCTDIAPEGETCDEIGGELFADLSELEAGQHSWELITNDFAGNSTSSSGTFVLDPNLPELELSGILVDGAGLPFEGEQAEMDIAATELADGDTGVRQIEVSVDGEVVETYRPDPSCTNSCPDEAETSYTYVAGEWDDGEHSVNVTVRDSAGNEESESLTINKSPALTCPTAEPTIVDAGTDVGVASATAAAPDVVLEESEGAADPVTGEEVDPMLDEPAQAPPVPVSIEESLAEGSVSAEPAGPVVIDRVACLVPTVTTADQTPADIVDETAAVYANSAEDTDTIVRPTATGATVVQSRRSAAAPRTFSWRVELPPAYELQVLPSGDIGIVDTTFDEPEERTLPTPPSGMGMPALLSDASTQLATATYLTTQAEHATGHMIAGVLSAPYALDAAGQPVPASMSLDGVGTVTVSAGEGAQSVILNTAANVARPRTNVKVLEGTVTDSEGTPTSATVSIVPPLPDDLEVGQEVLDPPPVVTGEAGSDGQFSLRVSSLAQLEDIGLANGGWANVEVMYATGAGLDTQSMPLFIGRTGWTKAVVPKTVTLAASGPVAIPAAPGNCSGHSFRRLRRWKKWVVVGELNNAYKDGTNLKYNYKNSADSSIQVAVSASGGPLKVEGFHRVDTSDSYTEGQPLAHRGARKVESLFAFERVRHNFPTCAGPPVYEDKDFAKTWKGHLRLGDYLQGTLDRCESVFGYHFGPGDTFARVEGKAHTWGGAVTVGNEHGTVGLDATTGFSHYASISGKFGSNRFHYGCGEVDPDHPSRRFRIKSAKRIYTGTDK